MAVQDRQRHGHYQSFLFLFFQFFKSGRVSLACILGLQESAREEGILSMAGPHLSARNALVICFINWGFVCESL